MVGKRLIDVNATIQKIESEIRGCKPVSEEDHPFEAFKKRVIPKLLRDVIEYLKNQPTVDAVEVVHGRWAHLGGDEWCCTACGEVIHTEGSWEKPDKKYCYECGAKMDGDGNV